MVFIHGQPRYAPARAAPQPRPRKPEYPHTRPVGSHRQGARGGLAAPAAYRVQTPAIRTASGREPMTATPKRKRRGKATDRIRQQRLRDRRKADGWRRVSLWLSPEQATRLETLGGDAWLGRTVKQLLGDVLSDTTPKTAKRTPKKPQGVLPFAPVEAGGKQVVGTAVSDTEPEALRDNTRDPETKAAFMTARDKGALMREVDKLLSQGLSGNDIARRFNAEGRRTVRGAAFVGQILLREWRKWKAT